MSDTGKQSPLGVNVVSSLLLSEGLAINPIVERYAGSSKNNADYTPGSIVNDTCLKWITYALKEAYNGSVDATTYDNMLAIGQSRIPALGNSKPPTYIANDPSGIWLGEANSGLAVEGNTDLGQDAKWLPYNSSNPNSEITQYGWIRCLALQAYHDFYWNPRVSYTSSGNYTSASAVVNNDPSYKDYVTSFMTMEGFVNYSNKSILTMRQSKDFLKGAYSNMNDLMSGDLTGVTLSTQAFGEDLVNLGKAFDLSTIGTFGLPSNLLKILNKNNTLTQPVILSMLSTGLSQKDIENISGNLVTATYQQEQNLFAAFLVITGQNLQQICKALRCRTQGLETLADFLNVKKIFPISYTTLTVPIYNTSPGPTNSKTYYLLFVNQAMNPQLIGEALIEQVGVIQPPVEPPVLEEVQIDPPPVIIEKAIEETIVQTIAEDPVQVQETPEVVENEILKIIETYSSPSSVAEPIKSPVAPAVIVPNILPTIKPKVKPGGLGCVVLESFVPLADDRLYNNKKMKNAYQLVDGCLIVLGSDDLQKQTGTILKALNDLQPCVRVTTEKGVSLVCSTSAPILTKEKGYIDAVYLSGHDVAIMMDGQTSWDKVLTVEDVGEKFVRVIDTGNNSFWAGEKDGMYMLHHNAKIYSEFSWDKK